jgi:hypothetical protein
MLRSSDEDDRGQGRPYEPEKDGRTLGHQGQPWSGAYMSRIEQGRAEAAHTGGFLYMRL